MLQGIGLNSKTVNQWIIKRRRELSGEPDPKAEDRELREARKRIRELEMENAFLKKPRPSSPEIRRSSALSAHAGREGRIPREACRHQAHRDQLQPEKVPFNHRLQDAGAGHRIVL